MKIKVLMLPKWYPSRLDVAEGNYVERHIKAISKVADVAVLYVHSDEKIREASFEIFTAVENDFPVVRVFFKRSRTGISFFDKAVNLYRYLNAQAEGYKVIKKKFGVPALTHVHVLTRTSLFALYLKWTWGICFVISEHWSGFLPGRGVFKGFFKTVLSPWLAEQGRHITCVSQIQKTGMQGYGFKGGIRVIPNVVDTELFRPGPAASNTGRKKIVHISRLDSHTKNLPGILKAIKQLREWRNDFELHLLGDGIEANKQKQLVKDLNLADTVFFHGYQNQCTVASMLSRARFLVMFSNYESQSCAILESFSCGVPVIATRVGGISEIMDETRGVMIEKEDEKKLAEEMNTMLDCYTKYNGEKIRSYALANFSESVIADQFLKIYIETLSEPG
jgi:glycosyltransferase involved in cell wall biosynthesis